MDALALIQTTINIDGSDVNFSNLNLEERMHDVGHFSFTLIDDKLSWEGDGSKPTSFYSKKVTLGFTSADDTGMNYHSFWGIITQQSSYHTGYGNSGSGPRSFHTNYNLSGSGMFVKLDGKKGCNSYLDKTLADVLKDINKSGETIDTKGIYEKDWPYLVQYNQTAFDFMKMLAARFGQWMYYDGHVLKFGAKPSGESISLDIEKDIQNLSEHGHSADSADKATGYDPKTGEHIKGETDAPAPSDAKNLKAAADAGADIYESSGSGAHYPSALNQKMLDFMHKLDQQAVSARLVSISANSHDARLSVGVCISITSANGMQPLFFSDYIITEIHHSANNSHGYSNYFTAVPSVVEVPPYTNPWLAPRMGKQPAQVMENEDKDQNRDLIKVKFPWMKEGETTPWIEVPSMYAGGENGGSVWTPEKDETVLIDFYDHNGERPHYAASLTTDKNKTNVPTDGNHIKSIGTASGRRLEIDDDKGLLVITDNLTDKNPNNFVSLKNKDDDSYAKISSQSTNNDRSSMILSNKEGINITLFSGGSEIVEIIFTKDKELSIKSKGKISIEADEEINMKAKNINIEASEKLSMEGTRGVEIKGMDIKAKADTNIEMEGTAGVKMKGATVEITADATAKIQSSGPAILKGIPVMIN